MADVQLLHSKHVGLTHALDGSDLVLTSPVEQVAGGAGFVNVGGAINAGAVTLDLALGRAFHHKMTGNIASLSFANVPDQNAQSAAWTWVLWVDPTGPFTLGTTPTVRWVDGSTFDDADLTADAVTIFTFWRVGGITYGALVTNGTLALEPYVFNFKAADSLSVPITRTEVIDVANATVLGAGTVTYKQDTTTITAATEFTAGTHAEFIVEAQAGQRISVPRYAP